MDSKQQPTVPEFTPATMTNIEAAAKFANVLKRFRIRSNSPIMHIAIKVDQVPLEQNGNTAVVTSTVITPSGSFQGVGTATRLQVEGQSDVQRTIDGATDQAMTRAFVAASLVQTGRAYLGNNTNGHSIVIADDGSFGDLDRDEEDIVENR